MTVKYYLISVISLFFLSGCGDSISKPGEDGKEEPGSMVLNISNERQLFVDDFITEKLSGNAVYQLHRPIIREIVFECDQPWEGAYSNYNTIFKDDDIYRMYYRGWNRGPKGEKTDDMVWCYAESKDGLHWVRPNLGLFEFNGNKNNNIVLDDKDFDGFEFHFTDNMTVFRDRKPGVDPEEKYKAFVETRYPRVMLGFKSPDGIHWSPMNKGEPIMTNGTFDTQNTVFWDSLNNEYRAFWRFFSEDSLRTRSIRTGVSQDFIHWEEDTDIEYLDTFTYHMYTNGVIQYYRAPQIFIGFPARYITRDWSEALRALPELEKREERSTSNPRYGPSLTESLFMASHDGVHFKRWNEAFLRPGIERKGTWNYGNQYIAWGMIETESDLDGAPNEISIFANEGLWTGNSLLRRYTIRLDGFVSVNAPLTGGTILTKPFEFIGNELSINFSTSAYGHIRVEVQDISGKAIPGYSLEECGPVYGDAIDRKVTWNEESDISDLKGSPVKLLFEIKDGDLYSFKFE